jgi:cytochrome bd-type quinol oxidase subunit 1
MIAAVIAFLLVVPACLGQTNGSATTGNQPDGIAAMTADAKQGNTNAQLKLAGAYMRGRGVTQNDAEGFLWFPGFPEVTERKKLWFRGSI